MRQLQLFTTAELARMRDRTASRNYSPERDEFRRTHERHRAWGLARRHAEKLRRSHDRSADPRPAATSEEDRTPVPSPARMAPPTSRQAGGPTTSCPAPISPTGDTPSAERKLPPAATIPRDATPSAPDSPCPETPARTNRRRPVPQSRASSGPCQQPRKHQPRPTAAQTPVRASRAPVRASTTGPGQPRRRQRRPRGRRCRPLRLPTGRPTKTVSWRQGQPWPARTPAPARQQAAALASTPGTTARDHSAPTRRPASIRKTGHPSPASHLYRASARCRSDPLRASAGITSNASPTLSLRPRKISRTGPTPQFIIH